MHHAGPIWICPRGNRMAYFPLAKSACAIIFFAVAVKSFLCGVESFYESAEDGKDLA
jgi:hypothetical protein